MSSGARPKEAANPFASIPNDAFAAWLVMTAAIADSSSVLTFGAPSLTFGALLRCITVVTTLPFALPAFEASRDEEVTRDSREPRCYHFAHPGAMDSIQKGAS